MRINSMSQVPIGTKVRLKKPYFGRVEGVVVAAERIIHNKPHRIVHTVLFDGLEDQYAYQHTPVTACFKATQFIVCE